MCARVAERCQGQAPGTYCAGGSGLPPERVLPLAQSSGCRGLPPVPVTRRRRPRRIGSPSRRRGPTDRGRGPAGRWIEVPPSFRWPSEQHDADDQQRDPQDRDEDRKIDPHKRSEQAEHEQHGRHRQRRQDGREADGQAALGSFGRGHGERHAGEVPITRWNGPTAPRGCVSWFTRSAEPAAAVPWW